ncbi:MoaD/ThiS family protein [Synechococcus sp. RSCCF101]|uniref:MoaD/ThiS family protein n=1 Tax=Synechococcus sp. RSCCF101 TaxID=2511069 RepID=UPI001243D981|nr:MoaD/ThiS family protein [Synechococcus sp. RSCCF101]QEY32613.1 MoaD/ThiS family protein [Synechococcus sp. RSCCF101]
MLTVRLLASLREEAGWTTRDVAIARGETDTPTGLWLSLGLGTGPAAHIRVAVNHALVGWDQPLQPGDEVAFLPPMTGG